MNKKSIVILSVLLAALLLFGGYKVFLGPKGAEGSKEVTIRVINKDQNIDETFSYKTDYEFLLELLQEKEEEIGASFEESSFGTMVVGMKGYKADVDKKEYFHILVNDADSMTGVGEIPLNDKDVYTFELRTW